MPAATPETVVNAWLAAWNAGDLEAVLALYADEIVTESPLLLKRSKTGPAKLEGKKALREYFAEGLAAAKQKIEMTPMRLFAGGEVAILEYLREAPHGGEPAVVERFVIRDGKIVESRVYWNADKIRDAFLKQ